MPELKFGPTYRYRILILDAAQRVIYDEITAAFPRVVVRETSSDEVFVSEGPRLRRLSVVGSGS